ncbi:hypothetical protein K456DRAFT_1700411 [Colletotrichum gloeosporioides 23]|nr:hypothetical protein K456DRAFT_1700411 [Colletotrichum gloeosporioides 23]
MVKQQTRGRILTARGDYLRAALVRERVCVRAFISSLHTLRSNLQRRIDISTATCPHVRESALELHTLHSKLPHAQRRTRTSISTFPPVCNYALDLPSTTHVLFSVSTSRYGWVRTGLLSSLLGIYRAALPSY